MPSGSREEEAWLEWVGVGLSKSYNWSQLRHCWDTHQMTHCYCCSREGGSCMQEGTLAQTCASSWYCHRGVDSSSTKGGPSDSWLGCG